MKRLLLLTLLAALLGGCTGEDAAMPSATANVAAPPTEPSVSEMLMPTATADPVPIQHTVWLINVAEGEVHTIYEHPQVPALNPEWVGPRAVRVLRASGPGVYDERGMAISTGATWCETSASTGVEVGGIALPDVPECGPISPDGQWMLYQEALAEEAYPPISAQWLLHVRTGVTHLVEQRMLGCGGCDSRFGPQWSLDGRFVLFAETQQDGRVFLLDLAEYTTRVVAYGSEVTNRPSWSPNADRAAFLVEGDDGGAVLVDADSGERTALPIGWPATFDVSGDFVYSFPWSGRDPDATTSVLDLATLELVEVEGEPPWSFFWWGDTAVAARDGGGVVAALTDDSCPGTLLYVSGLLAECLEGAFGAVPSRYGRQIAFAQLISGEDVHYKGTRLSRYDIVVMDLDTRATTVVAEGAYSGGFPPRLQWSPFGDLIVVSWPHFAGL